MKTPPIIRSTALASLALGSALAMAGCQGGNSSNVAGSSGPSGQTRTAGSSGTSTGGHQPATNPSHVGPSGAGPAGSQ